MNPNLIKTSILPNGVILSGYSNEYVYEKIANSQAFYE